MEIVKEIGDVTERKRGKDTARKRWRYPQIEEEVDEEEGGSRRDNTHT